jgi:hypothetical protein
VVLLECMSVLYASLGIHTRQRFTNLFGGSWEIELGYETTKKRKIEWLAVLKVTGAFMSMVWYFAFARPCQY